MSVIDAPISEGLVGQIVAGRYRVESILGEGGMGVVYRAVHITLGKVVALKVLRQDMTHDEVVAQRFVQEAKALSRIQHPHVVEVHDFGRTPEGITYFVMEYLEGRSLRDAIRDGSLDSREVRSIARAIAEGLSAAHAAGVIHRDLKPENIQLVRRDGTSAYVKVLDFGVAKVAGVSKLTRNGAIFGTPHYMSPEQAQGLPVDVRSDVYSYGIILYELVTGRLPFDSDSFVQLLSQQMFDSPPAMELSASMRELGALEPIVMRCLEKKSDDRFRGFDAVIDALDRAEAPSPSRGLYVGAGIAAGLALFGIVALTWAAWGGSDAAPVSSSQEAQPDAAPLAAAPVSAPASVAASAPASAPAVQPAPAVVREPVMVMLESEPSGAAVSLDGIVLGLTPLSVPRPFEGAKLLKIDLAGRPAKIFELDSQGPERILVRLPGLRPRAPRPKAAVTAAPAATTAAEPAEPAEPRRVRREVVDPWGD